MDYSVDVSNIKIITNLQEEMILMKTKLETLQNHLPNVSGEVSKKPVNEVLQTSLYNEPKANLKQLKTLQEESQIRIIREDFQHAKELEMDLNDSLEGDGNPNTLYSRKS